MERSKSGPDPIGPGPLQAQGSFVPLGLGPVDPSMGAHTLRSDRNTTGVAAGCGVVPPLMLEPLQAAVGSVGGPGLLAGLHYPPGGRLSRSPARRPVPLRVSIAAAGTAGPAFGMSRVLRT